MHGVSILKSDQIRIFQVSGFLSGAGLAIKQSWVQFPAWPLSSYLGLFSLPSFRGRYSEYRPGWLELWLGTFTFVRWQVTLCDPIWQVMLDTDTSTNLHISSQLTNAPHPSPAQRLPAHQIRHSTRPCARYVLYCTAK